MEEGRRDNVDEDEAAAGNDCRDTSQAGNSPKGSGVPEPPLNWKPNGQHLENLPSTSRTSGGKAEAGSLREVLGGVSETEAQEFIQVRKCVTVAQLLAIASLFVGGVLFSAISIGMAAFGFRRAVRLLDACGKPTDAHRALKRSAVVALGMSLLALAINAAALIVLYPTIVEIAQTGDFTSLFAGRPSSPSIPAPGESLWG